jgi:hypothetical protein
MPTNCNRSIDDCLEPRVVQDPFRCDETGGDPVMFKWIRLRRRRRPSEVVPEPGDADRDSGEDEYESQEEEARESSPSGMPRANTDEI